MQFLWGVLDDSLFGNKTREANEVLEWQNMKWREILKIARLIAVPVGWGIAQQKGDHPAQLLNNQRDSFTWMTILEEEKEVEQEEGKWGCLLKWLQVKHCHSMMRDLLTEG